MTIEIFFDAIKSGDVELVRSLLSANPKLVETQTLYGAYPLHIASEIGQPELVNILIEFNADGSARDNDGETPLFFGVLSPNYQEIVSLLLGINADINATDIRGQTVIHELVIDGTNEEQVRFLVSKGVDINSKSNTGATPLHLAAMQALDTYVRFLVENGAEVNIRDNEGYVPLHFAVYGNITPQLLKFHLKTAEELIHFGADVSAKSDDGHTPLDLARRHFGYPELAELLLAHGAT